MKLGLDFGSTYTTLSRYVDVTKQLQDISLYEGTPYIPSVVTRKETAFQYGAGAKTKTGKKGFTTYKAFKMMLPELEEARLIQRGYTKENSPWKITEKFLGYCLQEALERCGEEKIEKLVVGVPEVWNDHFETLDGRNLLKNICMNFEQVEQVQIISEPAAASAFFSYNFKKNNGHHFEGNILLIDYGGGTLDITLTKVSPMDHDSVEIKVEARTGAGENTNGEIGSAGILYMESLMAKAIEEDEDFGTKDEFIKDGNFYKAVDALEEEIKTGRRFIEEIFDEYGIKEVEALEEKEFASIWYRGREIIVTFGMMVRVYQEVIAPVFQEQLDKMIHYMEQADISYSDQEQEVFKVALVGGFGNFYLVEEQVRSRFHFSSMDLRFKNIIQSAMDREKAVSMGAALVASDIISIRNTAPYSIGFPGPGGDKKNADYAFRYKDDIIFDKPYFPHYKKEPVKPIAYFIGCTPDEFVVNNGEEEETAKKVRLKRKFVTQLEALVEYADNQHHTAIVGFSLDSSGVLSIHIRAFNQHLRKAEGEDHRIVLDSFKNMFEFSPIEY